MSPSAILPRRFSRDLIAVRVRPCSAARLAKSTFPASKAEHSRASSSGDQAVPAFAGLDEVRPAGLLATSRAFVAQISARMTCGLLNEDSLARISPVIGSVPSASASMMGFASDGVTCRSSSVVLVGSHCMRLPSLGMPQRILGRRWPTSGWRCIAAR